MLHIISIRYFFFLIFLFIVQLPVQAEELVPAENISIAEEIVNKHSAEVPLEDENENLDEDEYYPFETGDESGLEKEPGKKKSFFSFLDSPQAYLSSGVEGMARRIDRFFVEDEIFYESSGSYLRLIYSKIFEEGGKQRSLNKVRFKLRLPETRKRFKLFFESSARDEAYNVTTQTESTHKTQAEEGDYVLGIQAESGENFGWKYKPRIGAHLDSSIDTFIKFKFSREDKLGQWTVSWDETPYWQDSIGWGFDSSLVFNRKINEKNLFRSSTFAGWKNATEQFEMSQVFAIFHTFNPKKAISFYVAAYGVSEPIVHTTEYLLGSIYRKNIHEDYLFLEIEPQIRYQRINRFQPEHSIALRLELLFKK